MQLENTPVEKITFRNQAFYIKRDDLLHPAFSGNKARKFYYFLKNDFPDVKTIVSYGSPQANSLYSLSVLARLKHWSLDYYVDHVPSFLIKNPGGNYLAAIQNQANIIQLNGTDSSLPIKEYIRQVIMTLEQHAMFIPEGGHCSQAELGVKLLTREINQWACENNIHKLKIFLPSGTGTTAYYLQKNTRFEVLTCACVGDEQYLQQQFDMLSTGANSHPVILPALKKYHFGKLYHEFYSIWQELINETDIEFDLLYDPLGWITLLNYIEGGRDKTPILYIHQGGLLGNSTMLPRYQRKHRSAV